MAAHATVRPPGARRCPGPLVREYDAAELLAATDLHRAWDALVLTASEPSPFAEPWFMLASIRHLSPPASFRMITVEDARGMLIGMIPLFLQRPYGRIPLRHVQNWLHYHSFVGGPLISSGHERDFWAALLSHVDEARWAVGLLHLNGLVEGGTVHEGLVDAARLAGRPCDIVHRASRALLQSDLPPQAYYEAHVRKKKRKELVRLRKRLEELGGLRFRELESGDDVTSWCDAFLAMEQAGWKGRAGTALASAPGTERFFREVIKGARDAGRVQLLSLELDGRPIAMLANLFAPPGSFSFKIAFDEAYARYSPGVLIEIENLAALGREEIGWMDSCAAPDHPMIDSLWAERRAIVRVSLPLSGARRSLTFQLCRSAERASAAVRRIAEARRAAVAHV